MAWMTSWLPLSKVRMTSSISLPCVSKPEDDLLRRHGLVGFGEVDGMMGRVEDVLLAEAMAQR